NGVARKANGVIRVEIADHALATLVDKESVPADAVILYRGVSGQNLRIDVTENHLRGGTVIPGHHVRPQPALVLQQRPKVMRAEMPEIQYLHAGGRWWPVCLDRSVQTHETSCAVYSNPKRQRAKSLASACDLGKARICRGI